MAARSNRGVPESVDTSKLKFSDIGARRRRRVALAFLAGGALFVTSAAAMISQGASANGPSPGVLSMIFGSSSGSSRRTVEIYPRWSQVTEAPSESRTRAKRSSRRISHVVRVSANVSLRRPVCVRLCDGFFFPASEPAGASDAASQEAACSDLCPDAPTALFYQPGGSDKIEDAISTGGTSYTALPIALRYRATQDNTCSCHRSLASGVNPLRDATLRKGDVVMTPYGFLVFRGVEQATHTPLDFSALAASKLPKGQRTILQALERVSAAPRRGLARSWFATATPEPLATATSQSSDEIRFAERAISASN